MTDFVYRDAVPSDEEALVDLWCEMQSTHQSFHADWYADKGEDACRESWRKHFTELLEGEQSCVIVAAVGDSPVGFLAATTTKRPPIFKIESAMAIMTAAVAASYQRQGVFSGMLSMLEEKARKLGIVLITLSVDLENEGAMQAYVKRGFETTTAAMLKRL